MFQKSVIAIATGVSVTAMAQAHQPDGGQCAKINEDRERLICYDLVFKKTVSTSEPKARSEDTKPTAWKVTEEVSKIDDSKNVFMTVMSNETYQERYKKTGQCRAFPDLSRKHHKCDFRVWRSVHVRSRWWRKGHDTVG